MYIYYQCCNQSFFIETGTYIYSVELKGPVFGVFGAVRTFFRI